MAVIQMSTVRVKPGRLEEFMAHQDAIKVINARYGLTGRRLLRKTLAGEQTGEILIFSEFEDMAAYVRWNEERTKDPEYQEWRKTTPNANPDSGADLVSMVLLTDITR
jgi:heme-degrading monooxygenase HmoA